MKAARTIICPTCHREHGMFWLVNGSGKRTLSYRCNRVIVERADPLGGWTQHRVTKTRDVPSHLKPAKLGTLPEEWKKSWKAAKQAEVEQNLL